MNRDELERIRELNKKYRNELKDDKDFIMFEKFMSIYYKSAEEFVKLVTIAYKTDKEIGINICKNIFTATISMMADDVDESIAINNKIHEEIKEHLIMMDKNLNTRGI